MKFQKTLYNWLTTRYQLIIRSEENFEEKHTIPYTPSKVLVIAFGASMVVFWLGFYIASLLFNRPVFSNAHEAEMYNTIVRLNLLVDSLSEKVQSGEKYMSDFKKMVGGDIQHLKGEAPKLSSNDSANIKDKKKNIQNSRSALEALDPTDLQLRREFEGSSAVNSDYAGGENQNTSLNQLYFNSPLKGIVSQKFDQRTSHFGVDVVAQKDAPIQSIADGTVLLANWTDETGYTIAVQHKADFVSVYKHCSTLTKRIGENIEAGEVIAIIGNTGEKTNGPHLHFEIWYKGNPLNPEKFVVF
ncbi:MAG: M23 family metallopeptidase [Cytophagales bacterium]|nr:MAG: M23 family metallopeptidase [Cytophagales bacterium]